MVRRVVVTGLGVVTPLACGVEATWQKLLDGQGACKTITRFDASHLTTNYACEISSDPIDGLNPDDWLPLRERRKIDDFILYSIIATDQAIEDAGWRPETEEEQYRSGVVIGSGIGGLSTIAETTLVLKEKGPRRVSPFFYSRGTNKSCFGTSFDSICVKGTKSVDSYSLCNRRPCFRGRCKNHHG